MSEYKPYSIIGTLIALLVVSGTLLTTVTLKALGYPDIDRYRWNPVSIWIREHGFLILIIPLIWIACVIAYVHKSQKRESRLIAMISGLIILGSLAVLYFWTTTFSGMGRLVQTTAN